MVENRKDPPGGRDNGTGERFAPSVGVKEQRKLRARGEGRHGVWFGLGMFGLVGWSVAAPTAIGALLGVWIDSRWPGRVSWKLLGVIIGAIVGCVNAWFWVQKQQRLNGPSAGDSNGEH